MRSLRGPALGLLAFAAGFACLGIASEVPASAQVLSAAPYAPAPDPAITSLQNRVDALEADLRKSLGKVEQMGFELGQAKKAADDANAGRAALEKQVAELSARLDALDRLARGDPAAAAGAASGPAEAVVNLNAPVSGGGQASRVDLAQLPGGEGDLLAYANNLMLVPDYPSAQAAFQVFLKKYPKSASADEAQYQLAEAMLDQNDYATAADAYGKLLKNYPKSPHAPVGVAKLARSMRLLGKKPEACKALAILAANYPKAGEPAKTIAATEKARSGC